MPKVSKKYVCPITKSDLTLSEDGLFHLAPCGTKYRIVEGIPDFTPSSGIHECSLEQREYYDKEADHYDDVAYLSFRIQNEDEQHVRKKFVESLRLTPNSKVLDLACGTGRDSVYIAQELGATGELQLFDISRKMLTQGRNKLANAKCKTFFAVGNACHLPFPDNYFDAILSFGGLNEFGDIQKSFSEMTRVTKPGGRIVAGDESMPPWLYDTEFAAILMDNNHLFKNPVPFASIPREARDVCVRWIIGGVYYVIEFTVGKGEPTAKFDLPIPGQRGGTLRTRYHGRLEGVTPETKRLAHEARNKCGCSMHEWLDSIVKEAAQKELRDKS